jgi:hypothetical protein
MVYLLDNEIKGKILSSEGTKGNRGLLSMNLEPTDEDPEFEPDEPEELLGRKLAMNVKLEGASGLPEDLCSDPYVTYTLAFDTKTTEYTTGQAPRGAGGKSTPNCSWNYTKKHVIDCVTDYHLAMMDK